MRKKGKCHDNKKHLKSKKAYKTYSTYTQFFCRGFCVCVCALVTHCLFGYKVDTKKLNTTTHTPPHTPTHGLTHTHTTPPSPPPCFVLDYVFVDTAHRTFIAGEVPAILYILRQAKLIPKRLTAASVSQHQGGLNYFQPLMALKSAIFIFSAAWPKNSICRTVVTAPP